MQSHILGKDFEMINSDNLLQKYRPEILPEIVEERILRAKKCFFDLPIKEYSLDNLESFFRARSNRFKNDSISYGFRLMGDEIDVDNFIQTLNRAIEILDFDFMINEVTEEKLLSDFDTEMVKEFFYAISYSAMMNIHIKVLSGENNHHIIEAMFKAFARALDDATKFDDRVKGILSTKGSL